MNLSPDSRVWVYKSSRRLTTEEQQFIQQELDTFISRWAAHGNQLFGKGAVREDWFVVLAVDEAKGAASGCSIDTSVQFMKALGEELNVNFFDRMKVLIKEGDHKSEIHFSELGNHPDAKVYHPMVRTLHALQNNWLVPVRSSGLI